MPRSTPTNSTTRRAILFGLAAAAWHRGASSHGESHRASPRVAAPGEQKAWGIAATPLRVTRTVRVRMSDAMRFTPALIRVREGETLRIVAINDGRVIHEFVLGTPDENRAHAEQMKRFPDMEHDEPHMTHVAPGQRGSIVWHFNRAGSFEFACLIAGHYDAGMVGRVDVQAASRR
jgi:uncharacterized cupredoxin-like copper-binding protein